MTGPPIEEAGPAHVFEAASGGGHGVGSLPLADLAREHRNSGVADVPSSAFSRIGRTAPSAGRYEANRDQMRCDLCRARGLQVGSDVAEASASTSSGTGSNNRDNAGRKRSPTPCPPSNAASKTAAGPKSSIGGMPCAAA